MLKATISLLDVLMEKRFQLINVNLEEGQGEGVPLFDPNSTLDEVRKALCHLEATQNRLVQSHDGYQKGLRYANITEPLK